MKEKSIEGVIGCQGKGLNSSLIAVWANLYCSKVTFFLTGNTIYALLCFFPIQPAYAKTINKSHGQIFDHVGVFLDQPVFAHGQLKHNMKHDIKNIQSKKTRRNCTR